MFIRFENITFARSIIFLIILVQFSFNFIPTKTLAVPPDSLYLVKFGSGKVNIRGHFKNGLKHKRWTFYDENGRVTLKEQWKLGKLKWKAEYEAGKVSKLIDKNGNVRIKSKCGC